MTVAVITGAASGIGRAIALRCARDGMTVIAADIDANALDNLQTELTATGAAGRTIKVDVSDAPAVTQLVEIVRADFGGIDLLFNNAGVQTYNNTWESWIEEWQWTFGVNVFGVVNGIKAVVPIMADQGHGTIVNTCSMGGLTSGSLGVYRASKHAVVALTEALHHELQQRGLNIRVVAFCPDIINTNIGNSERNRPEGVPTLDPATAAGQTRERIRTAYSRGATPEQAAEALFAGLNSGDFYIYTDAAAKARIQMRMEDVLSGQAPRNALAARPPQ